MKTLSCKGEHPLTVKKLLSSSAARPLRLKTSRGVAQVLNIYRGTFETTYKGSY